MISRYPYRGGTWIDLEHPTESEVRSIVKEFPITERLEMELLSPSPAPLVANDTNATFMVLHFPTHGAGDGEIRDQEIDFIVGAHFVITVRYEVIVPLHRLKKLLETQALIAPDDPITTDVLLELLFTHLYAAVRDHTSHVANRATHIEHDMFNGFERVTVRAISNVNREFLHIEASLANQIDPLNRFLKAIDARGLFGKSFAERIERILNERTHVARLVATYRAVATELRETNAALLEARQNEIMKTLTVITFGMLPLELIALIFGMHALGTPFETNQDAFWIILVLMLATSGLVTLFLARKRWIS